ncbi:hypothetical protein KIL84_020477 [Mauremys mutica]|uniref:Uncharacterized protein n=1 Tax=Mauremys mutica TaxID=74926 RepID=A0A9D3XWV7_9SAUR|nr:hypothetical protein KIL84_020477 [Mauremys mutica]
MTKINTVFDGEARDPVTGKMYEYNSKSGARRWKDTKESVEPGIKDPLAQEMTKINTVFDGEARDPVTGKMYEYNSKSGARRWKDTKESVEPGIKDPLAQSCFSHSGEAWVILQAATLPIPCGLAMALFRINATMVRSDDDIRTTGKANMCTSH